MSLGFNSQPASPPPCVSSTGRRLNKSSPISRLCAANNSGEADRYPSYDGALTNALQLVPKFSRLKKLAEPVCCGINSEYALPKQLIQNTLIKPIPHPSGVR